MKRCRLAYSVPVLSFILSLCPSMANSQVPARTPCQLLTSPTAIQLGSQTVMAKAKAWLTIGAGIILDEIIDTVGHAAVDRALVRETSPLHIIVWIMTADSTALPGGLDVDRIWIASTDQLWESPLTDQHTMGLARGKHEIVRRLPFAGPRWVMDVKTITIIVRVVESEGNEYCLRVPNIEVLRVS